MIGKITWMSNDPLYSRWKAMRKRCRNKHNADYKYYGGKGVKVCEEWNDFNNFKKWSIDNGYKSGLFLDRIDSNKDYSPENCQYITHEDNCRKKTKQKLKWDDVMTIRCSYQSGGITQQQIADEYNVSRSYIANILINNNWKYVQK